MWLLAFILDRTAILRDFKTTVKMVTGTGLGHCHSQASGILQRNRNPIFTNNHRKRKQPKQIW